MHECLNMDSGAGHSLKGSDLLIVVSLRVGRPRLCTIWVDYRCLDERLVLHVDSTWEKVDLVLDFGTVLMSFTTLMTDRQTMDR